MRRQDRHTTAGMRRGKRRAAFAALRLPPPSCPLGLRLSVAGRLPLHLQRHPGHPSEQDLVRQTIGRRPEVGRPFRDDRRGVQRVEHLDLARELDARACGTSSDRPRSSCVSRGSLRSVPAGASGTTSDVCTSPGITSAPGVHGRPAQPAAVYRVVRRDIPVDRQELVDPRRSRRTSGPASTVNVPLACSPYGSG